MSRLCRGPMAIVWVYQGHHTTALRKISENHGWWIKLLGRIVDKTLCCYNVFVNGAVA